MNVAPHLLTEDRAEFERVLDEALRTAHERPGLADHDARLTTAQLREMALNATALITAAAAVEYDHFVKVREQLRAARAAGIGGTSEALHEEGGAGVVAIVTVLAPILAGTAAVALLLVGAILKMLDPPPVFADTLLTAGLMFGAVAAAGLLCAAAGLLVTALRNSATEVPAETPDDELSRARQAWGRALVDRGILPFVREALAAPAPPPLPKPPPPTGRIPKVGYSGPDFTSPSEGAPAPRPSFSSPDFTSPDFGPPEHHPE
ncbi:membrane protein [Streptomyces showdoensis]|uniref:Membrane protein n=2 Tax=Streptomyces showdoensis TaxID=68268 RepID=A0A2P2GMF5_STREW|nr:membrane protein [Streptomyces showdoensis]